MPAEQRIIGGGLLIFGIAVVLILIYFFSLGGPSPAEAFEQIHKEIYPAYAEAERKGDYLGVKRKAAEIVDVMESAGRAGVAKLFEQEGITSKEAKRIHELIKEGGFGKNAEGLYEFEGAYFPDTAHRALTSLRDAVDRAKVLRLVRDAAKQAAAALELARTGSGHAIPPAPARPVPNDDAPVVSPNPVYVNDAALYRVFGVKPADVEAALGTPAGGAGKARSARLRWNNEVPSSNAAENVRAVPDRIQELRDVASTIERATRDLRDHKDAQKKLNEYAGRAASIIASGLAAEHRAVFDEHKDKFSDGMAVARILRKEADLLNEYVSTVRVLGATFSKHFKE